jgi:hypothetical protein
VEPSRDWLSSMLEDLTLNPGPLCTVGGLETETCKHSTGNSPFKDTVLLIVSSDRVVS